MSEICIIQTHLDDALLSLGSMLLEKQPSKLVIITVSSNGVGDMETYQWLRDNYDNFTHIPLNIKDINYHEYFKIHTKKKFGYDFKMTYSHITRKVENAIKPVLKMYINDETEIYINLGAGHPMHYVVSRIKLNLPNKIFYYREFPHAYKKQFEDMFINIKSKFNLVKSYEYNDTKRVLFERYYKSQKAFAWFEKRMFSMKLNEEIYTHQKMKKQRRV